MPTHRNALFARFKSLRVFYKKQKNKKTKNQDIVEETHPKIIKDKIMLSIYPMHVANKFVIVTKLHRTVSCMSLV